MFNLDFLTRLRSEELDVLAASTPPGTRVLEFGAGTGEQARLLSDRGFDVVAIDLASSGYVRDRQFPVIDYDGRRIPLPDSSVDVIFSSNVLEHVEDLATTFAEFRRVLRPDGLGIHAMPTPAWRFWTFVSGVPTSIVALAKLKPKVAVGALLPIGHGTSWEGVSELWTFSPRWWRATFAKHRFQIVEDRPLGLFYTGHFLLGERLPFERRRQLARTLGSATHIYVVRPDRGPEAS